MSARDDHPALPLILAMDMLIFRPGDPAVLMGLAVNVTKFNSGLVRTASPDWFWPVLAALPEVSNRYLAAPNGLESEYIICCMKGLVKAAMAGITIEQRIAQKLADQKQNRERCL